WPLLVQAASASQITGKVDIHTPMITRKVKGQLPLAMHRAQDICHVTLNALLPGMFLQRLEELLGAVGTEADQPGELAKGRGIQTCFGDGTQGPSAIDEDLHVLVIALL